MRRPAAFGNWKMYKRPAEAREAAAEIAARLAGSPRRADVALFPAFPALEAVAAALRAGPGGPGQVALGAQDLFWEDEGPYTGEVSGPMLAGAGCRYVLVGHSERRQLFGETDEATGRKVRAALRAGLVPVLCVGETLAEREAGDTEAVVVRQVRSGLAPAFEGPGERPGPLDLLVAYEPVWAIGTGRNASAADAAQVIARIREAARPFLGPEGAQQLRVLYGGSVKPENIGEFARHPEIDGALVGGASLEPAAFVRIVEEIEQEAGG